MIRSVRFELSFVSRNFFTVKNLMFSDEAGVDLVHEVPIFRNKSVLSVNILDKFQNSIKYTRRIFFDFGVTSKKLTINPLAVARVS